MGDVTLEPAEYWKLMKLYGDLELATLQATAMVLKARSARDGFAKELAAKYPDFVPDDGRYRSDDATYTLIREK